MESILTSIKKLLGITEEYTHFDPDIIMHINSVFLVLNQLGVGTEKCFSIKDNTTTWNEFLPEGDARFEAVKMYMYMKVKVSFDPPMSSIAMEAMNRMIGEYEWRLNVAAENPLPEEEGGE